MINKDMLLKYVRIISGCDADPNHTLVDFSINEEQRNVVNTINNAAKKDKKLAVLLEDLKYSNNKTKDIEKYFDSNQESESTQKKEILNRTMGIKESYGFVNVASLTTTVAVVAWILSMIITFGS